MQGEAATGLLLVLNQGMELWFFRRQYDLLWGKGDEHTHTLLTHN